MKIKCYLFAVLPLVTSLHCEEQPPTEPFVSIQELEGQLIYNEIPYRLLVNKDAEGWTVELDDGAIWKASSASSANELKKWQPNDPIVIHPVAFPNWFGGRYFLLNERLNKDAVVELSKDPTLHQETNHQISYIDLSSGYLEMQDGAGKTSHWVMNFSDKTFFKNWKTGDSIIIGSNENCYAGWFSGDAYILINVQRNDYVRASLD